MMRDRYLMVDHQLEKVQGLQVTKLMLLLCFIFSCSEKEGGIRPSGNTIPSMINIQTDLVRYNPGQAVLFSVDQPLPENVKVRYKYLHQIINEHAVSGDGWEWLPPSEDYRGYMAEVFTDGEEKVLGTIAIDVSGNWQKFPRYGFLSGYPQMTKNEIETVIKNLAQHHINGLQFYDWHYKHHQPLAGTAENPDDVYQDIIGREIHFETVNQYIKHAHDAGMKAMSYNLIYGALKGASADGVSSSWYLYEDNDQQRINRHSLPQPPFISDIFVTNPAHKGWQEYLIGENNKVYRALDFDGFHMDQLGNRNTELYNGQGSAVDLKATFKLFTEAMKSAQPSKALVLNAVNQYGQEQIAQAPVGFLYSEVWPPNSGFADLADIILNNHHYSDGSLNTVLAAYLNYDMADNKGVFNTPAVLLADAVIFAFGGAHLELGEHMLGKEYFPNNNLMMRKDLELALVEYYDFLTAYENLLRDGGSFNEPYVTTNSFNIPLNNWPPKAGSVSVIGKEVENRQVLHLINFKDANMLEWRDSNGSQNYPAVIMDIPITFSASREVVKVWMASPDIDGGASFSLDFTRQGSEVSFTVPSLHFWDMVVIEYQ